MYYPLVSEGGNGRVTYYLPTPVSGNGRVMHYLLIPVPGNEYIFSSFPAGEWMYNTFFLL
jgi:hypothetical protein